MADETPSTTSTPPAAGTAPAAAPVVAAPAVTPAETPAPTPAAAVKPAELKFADGFDPTAAESLKAAVADLGLDAEKGQKFVDLQIANQAKAAAAQAEATKKVQADWVNALKADQEIGGADFDANQKVAARAVEKFGGADFKALLDRTGLGNHPDFARFCFRVGKAMADDSVAGGASGGGSAAPTDADLYRDLYKNTPSLFTKE